MTRQGGWYYPSSGLMNVHITKWTFTEIPILQNGHIWNVHFSHWTCPICGQGRNGSGHWAVRSHQSHHPTHPVTNRREHTLGAQTPGVRKGTCPQHPGVPRRNTRPRSVMNRRRTHLVICSRSQTTLHKQGKSFNFLIFILFYLV